MPIYPMPNGDRLVAPRVLARTVLITRTVVAVPDGYSVEEEDPRSVPEIDPERTALGDQSRPFWTEFLDDYLKLDDPDQQKAKPARLGYITFPLPARTSWLTVYRGLDPGRVGILLSCWRNTPGAYATQAIVDEWKAGGPVKDQLGGSAKLSKTAGTPWTRSSICWKSDRWNSRRPSNAPASSGGPRASRAALRF